VNPIEVVVLLLAGAAAGTINTIVGSGSLVTFPTLLALGYPPIVANVTNTVGLVPGSVSGAIGYRRELAGQRPRAVRLCIAAGLGGLTGAVLLLALPATAFRVIVPILIIGAVVLVAIQPRLSKRLAHLRVDGPPARGDGGWPLLIGVYLTGIYGGYFGAAQGVILIAILAVLVADDLQRLNGLKNVIAAVINAIAALFFIVLAPIHWPAAIALAVGATVGGQLGAHIGRRLSPTVLRAGIIVVGTVVAIRLLLP
jgi:uncharacterized protein